MPESVGIHGIGTTLTGSIAGQIFQIRNVNPDGFKADDLEKTNMDSEEGWREFFAGLKDAGAVGLDLVYKDSEQDKLVDALGVSQTWTVELPTGSTFECVGYINQVGPDIPYDDVIMISAQMRWSGKPIFTAA